MNKTSFFILFIIYLVCSILTGCNREASAENPEEQTQELLYTVLMQRIPDPDNGLDDSILDPYELDYRLAGDVLYRLVSVMETENKSQIYLQTLAAPYETWASEKVDFTSLPGPKGKAMNGWGLTDTGEVYVTYYYLDEESKPENTYLAIRQGGSWKTADALPVQEALNGPYTADTSGIYRQEGDEQIKLLSWSSYGFSLYDVPIMLSVVSEEQMLLACTAAPDYRRVLLFVSKGQMGQASEKQKIILAVYRFSPMLQKVVASFNQENDTYEIVVREFSQESGTEARERLQIEISTGGGPDLIDSFLLDLDAYAQRGYLEPLDDWLSDRENFLPQAMEYSRVGEHYYFAPYGLQLCTVVTTAKIADGRTRWTVKEMMETARSQGTETLYWHASAAQVLAYALHDEENPAFIDWKNKICHLETDEFVELLRFARNMADSSDSPYPPELNQAFADHAILISDPFIGVSLETYYNELNVLGEDCVLIGYPMENGNGSYVAGCGFAINQASQCKEGARAFLEYLMDPDQQIEMGKESRFLPIDREALQSVLTVQAKALANDKESSCCRAYNPEEVEQFYEIILRSRTMGRQIDDIFYILEEEMAAYCQEDKDPWEVARILQNRVQLYLDEQ